MRMEESTVYYLVTILHRKPSSCTDNQILITAENTYWWVGGGFAYKDTRPFRMREQGSILKMVANRKKNLNPKSEFREHV